MVFYEEFCVPKHGIWSIYMVEGMKYSLGSLNQPSSMTLLKYIVSY